MSISVGCTSCGKYYKVGEVMAGRTVKCKSCGSAFRIPRRDEISDELPDLNVLADAEPAIPVVPQRRSSGVSAHTKPAARVEYVRFSNQTKLRKSAVYEDWIHNKLPIALVFFGYVVPLIVTLIRAFDSPRPVMSVLVVLAWAMILIGVVTPITVLGLKLAARLRDFDLVYSPGFRALAAFAAPPLAMCATIALSGVSIPVQSKPSEVLAAISLSAMLGLSLGLIASFFILWLLFRLEFLSAMVAWFLSGLAYVLGTGVGVYVLLLGIFAVSYFYRMAVAPVAKSATAILANEPPATGAATQATAPPPAPEPAPATATDPLTIEKRDQSAFNLRQIGAALLSYMKAAPGSKFPPTLDELRKLNLPDATLSSPIGHASVGPDFVYRYIDGMSATLPSDYVLAYDAASLQQGEGTNILRANGEVDWVSKDQFDSVIAAGDAAANRALFATASPDATGQSGQTDVSRSALTGDSGQRSAGLQPFAPTGNAVEPPAPPAVATPAWQAQPDCIAILPKIRPTVRQVFAHHAQSILYPTQPSSFVYVGDDILSPMATPTDGHDIWNLQTVARAGHIVGQLSIKDPVISPDGQYIAGRATGGPGEATTFEVWSFRTGALAQTIAEAPMAQSGLPLPVGFVGNTQLITLDDGLRVWDIKTGGLERRLPQSKRGPNELVAASASGKLVAVLDADQNLTLFDAVHGKNLGQTALPPSSNDPAAPVQNLPHFGPNLTSGLAFSPSGTDLAVLLGGPVRRIVDWSVADATVAGNFTLPPPVAFVGFASQTSLPLAWLPDSNGWLVQGREIVDRVAGVVLYEVPEHHEPMAEEFGPRKILDSSHILMSFKSFDQGIGMETFALPADTISKARAAARQTGN